MFGGGNALYLTIGGGEGEGLCGGSWCNQGLLFTFFFHKMFLRKKCKIENVKKT